MHKLCVHVEENRNLKLKKAIHMLNFSELNNNILVNLLIILLINYADNIELSMLSVILLMVFFSLKCLNYDFIDQGLDYVIVN